MEQGEQSIERSNTRLNRSRSKRLQGQKIFSTLFRPKGANYLTLHFHHTKIPFCLIVCKWNEWIIGKTADLTPVSSQCTTGSLLIFCGIVSTIGLARSASSFGSAPAQHVPVLWYNKVVTLGKSMI